MPNNIIRIPNRQGQIGAGQVLIDRTPDGNERPWSAKKRRNEKLANVYASVNMDKAVRLHECGTTLVFEEWQNGDRRLHSMNSCRVRLCPICAWRRSLKVFANTMKIVNWLTDNSPPLRWAFLTLTVRNVSGDLLASEISRLMESWNRFMGYAKVQSAVLGWYRGLEITYNAKADTYHPHFHVLMCVEPKYFSGRKYIPQAEWRKLWAEAANLDYLPEVNVQAVKTKKNEDGRSASSAVGEASIDASVIAEVAKYSVKDTDYILCEDYEKSADVVRVLDFAMAGRRLVSYGGNMKKAHKFLNLDDEEHGDLIHVGEEEAVHSEPGKLRMYFWYTGASVYRSAD